MRRFASYGEGIPGVDPGDLTGWLIVIEGTDGVGRTTHVNHLRAVLEREGFAVAETGLTRSDLAASGIRLAKQGNTLGSNAYNLFYATDFADRYVYTAFARDVARGVDPRWVRSLYRFAVVPTMAFYFRTPLEVALKRILSGRPKLKHYEAGMDLNLHADIVQSYRMFQARILEEYEHIVHEYELTVMDATRAIETQQRQLRKAIAPHLVGLKRYEEAEA